MCLYSQDNDKKDESSENAATTKKADSDSEEEENDNDQKEKGISNKKKKVWQLLMSLFYWLIYLFVLHYNFCFILCFRSYANKFMLCSASTTDEDCWTKTNLLKAWCCWGWNILFVMLNFWPSFIALYFYCVLMVILQVNSFFFNLKVWDATAADPKLLVFLKSYRNTVPVPRHWCQKRKFLQVNKHFSIYRCMLKMETCLMGVVNMRDVGIRLRKITSIQFLLYVYMWCLQGSCCDNHQAWTCRCLAMGILESFIF